MSTAKKLTPEEIAMKARIKELESELEEGADSVVDPTILAKARTSVRFSVMDVSLACQILKVQPTAEQQHEIEQAILKRVVTNMTDSASRDTIGNWETKAL